MDRAKAPEVVGRIISRDILEHLGDGQAGPIVGETRNSDRLKAIEFAASYLEGKPSQSIELSTPEPLLFRLVRE